MRKEDIAIVLRSSVYQERDRLVSLLTQENGRITGIAKGAVHSRRFGNAFDLLQCVEVAYFEKAGRELVRIEAAKVKHEFSGIRLALEKISAGSYFAELCLRLLEEKYSVKSIFLLLTNYLYSLSNEELSMAMVHSYEIKLLDRLGYSPILQQCTVCATDILAGAEKQSKKVRVDIMQGGVQCEGCANSGKIYDSSSLLWLQVLRGTPVKEFQKIELPEVARQQIEEVLQAFLQFHCPGLDRYQFKSYSMLRRFLMESRKSPVRKSTRAPFSNPDAL